MGLGLIVDCEVLLKKLGFMRGANLYIHIVENRCIAFVCLNFFHFAVLQFIKLRFLICKLCKTLALGVRSMVFIQ